MATVKKNKKKMIIAICAVLVVAIAGTSGVVVAQKNKGKEATLYTISAGDIYEKVSLTGDVTSGTRKDYKVSSVATVKEVFVKVGDKVKQGDVLATFDVSDLDAQISSLQETYNEAQSDYNKAVKEQKSAQNKSKTLQTQISAMEKTVKKLEEKTTVPSTAKPSTRPTSSTTRRTTTTKTTTITTTTTTTKRVTTTLPPSANPAEDLANQIRELNEKLTQITEDLDTLTKAVKVIADTVSQLAGSLNPDEIADEVLDKLIDSGISADVAKQIVESIDFQALVKSVSETDGAKLSSAQIQLMSLQAQKAVFDAKADPTVVNAQKKALKTSKQALDVLKAQRQSMSEGWVAAFDGTITAVDVTPGVQTTLVSPGITLENLDSMAVTVSLGEYDLHKVKVGMTATVTTAFGKYEGEVVSIAPTATGGDGSSILDNVGSMAGISGLSSLTASGAGVDCVIAIPEADENITVGFDADVEIVTGEYHDITVVPIESIKLEKTGSYVYLYNPEEKTATKTLIETGAVSDTAYEVKSGINIGDQIIAAPAADYEDDTFKVKVITNKK